MSSDIDPKFGVDVTQRQTPSYKPILCLDFDGVLHSYTSGWQGAACIPDPPVPGAIEFILQASVAFSVNVFSTRSHQPGGIEAMQAYLKVALARHFAQQTEAGKIYGEFAPIERRHWKEAEHALSGIAFPTTKPPASVGIDDRQITFTGTWPSIKTLQAFKPWNK